MNPIFAAMPRTIFDVMSGLARDLGAVNLGQGFPEEDGPRDLKEAVARATLEQSNQYPPMMGLPALREAVADHYIAHQGLDLDWRTEVTITSGATEAIAAAIFATLAPGDEAILFEPMYDAYRPLVERAGGVAKYVRLEPPHWRVPETELRHAFTDRTRLVILNSPLNPSASLIGAEDLKRIAHFCVAHDAIALCDEVWEHVVFDEARHETMLSIPGMRARTIKIGSAGKMFSMTGWKVGFLCAAPALTEVIAKAHQFLTFTTPPNLQAGAAFGLRKDAAYFTAMREGFQTSRNRLSAALAQEGFAVLPCAGTYFLNIDLAASGISMRDEEFALHAVKEHAIAAIPLSPFYAAPPTRQLLRLCFAKSNDTLDKAVDRLSAARRALN